MKRWRLLSAVMAVSCVATGVRAEYKKLTFFGQAEYLTYSDAFEKNEALFKELVDADRASLGVSESLTSNTKTAGGVGFRIGAMARTPFEGLTVGGSLGYIMGPRFEGKENILFDDGVNTQSSIEKWEDESKLWRYMGETKMSLPVGEKLQVRVGFAMGVAALKVTEKVTVDEAGDFVTGSATSKHSISTMKLTWEIGPAIAYVTDQIGVELALTYSHMPGAEDLNTFQEFKWSPFGVRLGVEF